MDILKTAKKYFSPFMGIKGNRNTGNKYEFDVALTALRHMGLTDSNIEDMNEMFTDIESRGKGNSGLSRSIDFIKKIPVGTNFHFNGKKIVDIENLTQDDKVGTPDLFFVCEDTTKFGISITEGTGTITKNGLSKVITNAGSERMGCTPEDKEAIIKLENLLSVKDKDEFCKIKFGTDESKWKKTTFPAAIKVQSDCATLIANRLVSLPDTSKRAIMNDILCISTQHPADYFAFVNKKSHKITYYKINGVIIDADNWIPRIESKGVFIHTYCGDVCVSKSQVKYNNGVGTSMRKINVGAVLNTIFNLTKVT